MRLFWVVLLVVLLGAWSSIAQPSSVADKDHLLFVLITKVHAFRRRLYRSYLSQSVDFINRNKTVSFHGRYHLTYLHIEVTEFSPPEVLRMLCDSILVKKASLIFYLSEQDSTDYKSASAEFLLQTANFLGLPVIVLAEDNSGIVQPNPESTILQMTPSIEHQGQAMLSLLQRYNWPAFGVVTGSLAGHELFINSLHRLTDSSHTEFDIQVVIKIPWTENTDHVRKQLTKLNKAETRVVLLYASHRESERILQVAREMGQVGRDFIWIMCKTAIGLMTSVVPSSFYPGLLAVDFNKATSSGGKQQNHQSDNFDMAYREKAIRLGVITWAHGISELLREQPNASLVPQTINCSVGGVGKRWKEGQMLIRHMKSLSTSIDDKTQIAFNEDGTVKDTELNILNLDQTSQWQVVGEWHSRIGLHMGDITWPGGVPTPPKGRPAKYHMRIVTLEEQPYVVYSDPDPQVGTCPPQSELCRIAPLNVTNQFSNATTNSMLYQCCSGFCIDLLRLLSEKMGFDFELFEVPDKKWGAYDKTKKEWIGLVRTILDGEADMVVTSLQITPERSEVIDFSVPFLETGITIIVAVRDGVISPTAFLEPYDYPSWCLILLFSVHVSGAAIFIVEWLSPHGLDTGEKPIREHKFSLFRSFWLIWSMLFGAAVNVDNPRGVASRFLANIWALFAVVFTASYTANLAAFMITKEDYDRLTGIQDKRLLHPYTHKPPFKYATVPYGSTETNLINNFPEMYEYMRVYNKSTAVEGVRAVKEGEINAFIYDATVLEYQASHDDGCKLRTINSWHAMTGYGIGFPKGSKWMSTVNQYIIKFQYDGELERLQKFWFSGSCKKNEAKGESSKPLGILNFTSAFILLACGMILGAVLMIIEHVYFKFFRAKLRKWDSYGCCSLISLSLGKSLTFQQSVKEAIEMTRNFKCRNPVCETQVWKLKHELDLARLRIVRLQQQIVIDDDSAPSRRKSQPSSAQRPSQMNTRFSLNSLRLTEASGEIIEDAPPTLPPNVPRKSIRDSIRPQGQTVGDSKEGLVLCPPSLSSDAILKSTKSRPASWINPRPFNYKTKPEMESSALTVAPSTSSVASAATAPSNQSDSGSGFEFGYDGCDVRRVGKTVIRGGGGGGGGGYTGATSTTSAAGGSSLADASKGQSFRSGAYHRKRERLRFVSRSCPSTPVRHRYVAPLTEARKDGAPVACSGGHVRDPDRPAREARECSFHMDDHFKGAIRFFSSSELPQVHYVADKDFNRNSNVGQNYMEKSLIEIETAL